MAQPRVYSVPMNGVTVSALQDLYEIQAPADACVILYSVRLGQESEEGEAQSEMLRISFHRFTISGSGGSLQTPNPLEVGSPAFGGTVEMNNTSPGTGTNTELFSDTWNLQIPWLYQPPPEERIVISPSGFFGVRLPVAPADAITMTATITFEELGG